MKESWTSYLKLGINHHLLFPESFESAAAHRRSLPEVLAYPEFEVIDVFVPSDPEIAAEEIGLLLAGGKEPIYNCPLMTGPGRNPHSPDAAIRSATIGEAFNHLRRARQIGARKAVIASGPNPGESHKAEQSALFTDYVDSLCAAFPELELLVEPFDRSIGKNLLIGSTREAAETIRTVRGRGQSNAGLLVDMGHIPLMNESFEGALGEAAPYIRHIHLGSCVKSNPLNPLYGDMHPPWGYPDGENDVPELADFLRRLFVIGYLGGQARPTVTLEMRPYPGTSERGSVETFLEKLQEAWTMI